MQAAITATLLRGLIREGFAGRIALVSAFGADSAVLLHMVAGIDPALPVIFLDTGKLFAETLADRDALVARLGLADVRAARPDRAGLAVVDPTGDPWPRDPDRCCAVRKVAPLARALAPFDAWISGAWISGAWISGAWISGAGISGRERFQGGTREPLETIEFGTDWRIRINPLARWTAADVAAYCAQHDLPAHPLRAAGCRSSGGTPGTPAGRWDGHDKTERGIHRASAFTERVQA